jgi:acylpyruvate hydrolase
MRLAVIETATGTAVVREAEEGRTLLPYADLTELLALEDWQSRAQEDGTAAPADARLAPVVRPGKVLCVGLNYRRHIEETGKPVPEHPTLFAKFADSLVGATSDIFLPAVSSQTDWEAELGVVIGRAARRVPVEDALDHVAGYTVVNDVSMRDWQNRTSQWLQGKTFDRCTPVGPVMVTPDEVDHARDLEIRCQIGDETVQSGRTSDLLFSTADLVSYISQFTTLRPGDLILTGTPSGIGNARNPKRFLQPGEVLITRIDGIGELRNRILEETATP